MIKTLHDLDKALDNQKVTFMEKETFDTYQAVYQFGATHELLDMSTKLKVDAIGRQILSELYKKDNKLYELETVYDSNSIFLYAVATEIVKTE